MVAGILLATRRRRATPLPNSERASPSSLMVVAIMDTPCSFVSYCLAQTPRRAERHPTRSEIRRVDNGSCVMCQHAHFPRQSNNCQVYANSGLWRGDASMTLHPAVPATSTYGFREIIPNFVKNVRLPVLIVRFPRNRPPFRENRTLSDTQCTVFHEVGDDFENNVRW